ncbi:MAG: ATP-binding protein, partial [Luminiphilus sp.]|nr:ATP-binding protein [Luminiphilus sp.]
MLLQPLVENAIKYAIAKSVSGGTIRITAARKDDWLLLCVSDDGPGLESPDVLEVSGTGVGIANIKGRLQELYGSRQACELRPSDPSGLAVDIRLPLHKNDPSGAS